MWLTGHLATSYLLAKSLHRSLEPGRHVAVLVIAALVGGSMPDLIDKPLLLARITPYGRSVGHALTTSLLVLSVTAWPLAAGRLKGSRKMLYRGVFLAFAASWWAHLFIDLIDDTVASFLYTGQLFTAWMGWPYLTPDDMDIKGWRWLEVRCRGCVTPLEWVAVAVALGVAAIGWRRRVVARRQAG